MAGGWVYIVTDKPYATLYIGVTGEVARRAWEHREGISAGFTQHYGLKLLVYTERHEDIRIARQLIQSVNPTWADLYDTLF